MTSDRDMTRLYMQALTGSSEAEVTWQYFPDQKDNNGKRQKAGHPHGSHRTHYRNLEKKQADGCGVYVMVNEGDGKGRKAENVIKVRAVFIDLDGSPKEPAVNLLKPHIVVESSPGRFHLYWIVSDCPLAEFKPLQKAIAAKFDGDISCIDLCRVLRVPGFWHLKKEPYLTRLLEVNEREPYTVAEVIIGLQIELSAEAPIQQPVCKASADVKERSSNSSATLQYCSTNATADTQQSGSTEIMFPDTGEIIDLKKWAACNADFDLLAALAHNAPQVLRGKRINGKQHIQCPFESEHTDQSADHATFAANKGNGHASWDIHCMHAHCIERDRLDFFAAMVRKGWMPINLLSGNSVSPVLDEHKRPRKIYLPYREMATDIGWSSLHHEELRIGLHLFLLSCREPDGRLVDDNWQLARLLGLEENVWGQFRTTLERSGCLQGDGIRLWLVIAEREVKAAIKAYTGKVEAGRERQRQHTRQPVAS